MTRPAPISLDHARGGAPAFAQLRNALMLVERIAGEGGAVRSAERLLDDEAVLTAAYEDAADVTRRRFDALAGEAASYAAVGVEALIGRGGIDPECLRAAAAPLARELRRSLAAMARLLGVDAG